MSSEGYTTRVNAKRVGEHSEIARCLRAIADRMEAGETFDYYRNILDINGNIVGQFAIKPE